MLVELQTVRPGSAISLLGHELKQVYFKYLGEGLCVPLQVVAGPQVPEFIVLGDPRLLPAGTRVEVIAEPPIEPPSAQLSFHSTGWQNPALVD